MARKRGKCGKVIFRDLLEAKIALANRQRRDKGEKRVRMCQICGPGIYHLTSQELESEPPRSFQRQLTGTILAR